MFLNPEYGTMFWTSVTFIALFLILKKMAWGPLLQSLAEREQKIKESLDKADAAQKKTEQALAKNQEVLDAARKEAQELLNKSRKTAEASKEEIIQKARTEATNLLERAKKEITQERDKAVEEIKNQTADISISIASKLIGKSLSSEDHKDIIEESLKKMDNVN